MPGLVGITVAGPDLLLGTVHSGLARVVEALARAGTDQGAVRPGGPLLVGAAVAGPQLDENTVGGPSPGDVEALAAELDDAARHGPLLGRVPGGAGGQHRRGTVGGPVRPQALAGQAGGDGPGVCTGARTGDAESVELDGLVADETEADVTGLLRGVGDRLQRGGVQLGGDGAAGEPEGDGVPVPGARRGGCAAGERGDRSVTVLCGQ